MFDRRTFLKTGAACAAFTLAGARAQFAHAALPDDRRLVVIILRGGLDGPARVTTWIPSRMPAADEEFLSRVAQLYANDPVFSNALKQGLETRSIAAQATHDMLNGGAAATGYGAITPLMDGAGKILAAEHGPRVAVFDITCS